MIRWEHPVRGLISPAGFICAAEETGLIIDIGDWVFRESAKLAARWRASYHPEFQVSIDMSPVQFRNENVITEAWVAHLQKLGVPGQSVVIEITEGLLLDASTGVTKHLLAFRDAGSGCHR